jgi:hypothetical protein
MENGVARSLLVTPNLADPRTLEVRRDLEAAAWSIQDVHARDAETDALLRRPDVGAALATRVDALVASLPVRPVEPSELSDWAAHEAERALQHAG